MAEETPSAVPGSERPAFPVAPGTAPPPEPPAPGAPDPDPFAHQPIPPEASKPHAPLGTTGLVLGIAALVLSVAFDVVQAALVLSSGFSASTLTVLGWVRSILIGLLGLAALILGLAGVVREPRKGLAGIGAGIGIALVAGVLSSLIYGGVLTVVSRF